MKWTLASERLPEFEDRDKTYVCRYINSKHPLEVWTWDLMNVRLSNNLFDSFHFEWLDESGSALPIEGKTAEQIIIDKVGEFWWICGKHKPEFLAAMEEYAAQFKTPSLQTAIEGDNRCPYENAVIKFFGLPESVNERQKIDADFGILVNLVCAFDTNNYPAATHPQPAAQENKELK